MAETIGGDNFVWYRSLTDAQAIALLIRRFSFVLELGESETELAEMGAFYAYGIFSNEIVKRGADEMFLREVAEFINELATSNDSYLEELAWIGILEAIADMPEIDEKLNRYLGAKALEMRKQIGG